MYSSSCIEATDFLGTWLDVLFSQFEEEIALGSVDCTKYPNECERCSKDNQAAFFFDKSGAYVPIDENILDTVMSLNETLSWAICQDKFMDPVATHHPVPYKLLNHYLETEKKYYGQTQFLITVI